MAKSKMFSSLFGDKAKERKLLKKLKILKKEYDTLDSNLISGKITKKELDRFYELKEEISKMAKKFILKDGKLVLNTEPPKGENVAQPNTTGAKVASPEIAVPESAVPEPAVPEPAVPEPAVPEPSAAFRAPDFQPAPVAPQPAPVAAQPIQHETPIRSSPAQVEERMRVEEEAQLRVQQEEQMRAQQQAQFVAQQEAQQRAQFEAQQEAQQQAQFVVQQEAQAREQHEAQLEAQARAQHEAQLEAQARAQHEAQLEAQGRAQMQPQQPQMPPPPQPEGRALVYISVEDLPELNLAINEAAIPSFIVKIGAAMVNGTPFEFGPYTLNGSKILMYRFE